MERRQGQLPTPSAHPYALQDHTHLKGASDFSQEKYNISCEECAGARLYKTLQTDFAASKKGQYCNPNRTMIRLLLCKAPSGENKVVSDSVYIHLQDS
jgi:hypothetical protein